MCRPHTCIYVGFSCVAIYECDFVLAILTCDSCLRFMAAIHRRDLYVRFVSVLCIRDWKMRFVLAICRCDSKMRFIRALSSCDFMTVILSAIHKNDVALGPGLRPGSQRLADARSTSGREAPSQSHVCVCAYRLGRNSPTLAHARDPGALAHCHRPQRPPGCCVGSLDLRPMLR